MYIPNLGDDGSPLICGMTHVPGPADRTLCAFVAVSKILTPRELLIAHHRLAAHCVRARLLMLFFPLLYNIFFHSAYWENRLDIWTYMPIYAQHGQQSPKQHLARSSHRRQAASSKPGGARLKLHDKLYTFVQKGFAVEALDHIRPEVTYWRKVPRQVSCRRAPLCKAPGTGINVSRL